LQIPSIHLVDGAVLAHRTAGDVAIDREPADSRAAAPAVALGGCG